MLLDEKPIESLEASDIERLVSEAVCETQRLEYKRDWWGDNDEGKREMLRDISAFANGYGGHLVLGVDTEKGAGAGDQECPTQVVGLPRGDYRERVLRSCRDNFDPLCVGVQVWQIEVRSEKTIVVIRVPQSLDAPHMVTFKGLNQFWQRHGTDKQPMSSQEIRDLLFGRVSYEERLLQLLEHQQDAVAKLGTQPLLHIWASPVVPLPSEIDINDQHLRQLLGEAPLTDPFGYNCELYSGRPFPTLVGLRAEASHDRIQYLELHRRGYLEFVTLRSSGSVPNRSSSQPQEIPAIIAGRFAIYLENFASLVGRVFSEIQVSGPIAFGCAILNASGYRLTEGRQERWLDPFSETTWDDMSIDLGHQVTYDFEVEKDTMLRVVNDRLWNAFHYDGCPYYSTGRFVLPR